MAERAFPEPVGILAERGADIGAHDRPRPAAYREFKPPSRSVALRRVGSAREAAGRCAGSDGEDWPASPPARADAACVLDLHTVWGQTLAAIPEGLLPCSQPAMRLFRRLGRHPYEGLAFTKDEQARLVAALGALDGLILENHGILTVGRTVGEAFVLMTLVERAAQVQVQAMAATGGRPRVAPDEVAERTYRQWVGDGTSPEGADEWPALLRSLDD